MNILIIGGGQVGEHLAKLMIENRLSVKIIDNRESIVARLRSKYPPELIFLGDGTDTGVLEACGISEADVVAAVTGADESNLVVSTIAKYEFNVPRVIARVNNPRNEWLYNSNMGVDVAINQADIMAHLIVEEIDIKNMMTLMKTSRGKRSIVQIQVDEGARAAGKLVRELELPHEALLIAIHRGDDVIIPRGGTQIMAGDGILAFINDESRAKLNGIFCR